jgi:hypothetical protein
MTPTPTPTPKPTPTPTPKPTATPVANTGIIFGVGGHDGVQASYPLSTSEARFQLLDAHNFRTYRIDVSAGSNSLDTLIPLAKKYNVTLRPMLYPTSQSAAYAFAKKYANDIKVWEIGNEQDFDKAGAQGRINAMVTTYKGIKQASDELGAGIKTSINIMACNSNDTSASARCPNDTNGAIWFLDMAKASGWNFDYITFHYYAYYTDAGYWTDLYMGQVRNAAKKYNTKVFINETNCAEIYKGNTDGGFPGDKGCYDSMVNFFTELKNNYSDVVQEVTMYELLDEPYLAGAEQHFGLMYNMNSPKKLLDVLTQFAKK